jgi:hypothetical protein
MRSWPIGGGRVSWSAAAVGTAPVLAYDGIGGADEHGKEEGQRHR